MVKDTTSIPMTGIEACNESDKQFLHDSRLVTVKVLLNAQEHLIMQKKWLVFDLHLDSEWLATYECSQEETFALISAAVADSPTQIPKLLDLVLIFAKKCKFSHSERLKKWAISFERNFCENQVVSQETLNALEEEATAGGKYATPPEPFC